MHDLIIMGDTSYMIECKNFAEKIALINDFVFPAGPNQKKTTRSLDSDWIPSVIQGD